LAKLTALLRFAATGWIAGVAALLLLSFAWPSIFPGFVNYRHYDPTGPAPNLVGIVLTILMIASLPAIIGGVVGAQIPKEGGQRQQLIMSVIFGIILAVPIGCMVLWLFSGY
jgi:hypothetical protein